MICLANIAITSDNCDHVYWQDIVRVPPLHITNKFCRIQSGGFGVLSVCNVYPATLHWSLKVVSNISRLPCLWGLAVVHCGLTCQVSFQQSYSCHCLSCLHYYILPLQKCCALHTGVSVWFLISQSYILFLLCALVISMTHRRSYTWAYPGLCPG